MSVWSILATRVLTSTKEQYTKYTYKLIIGQRWDWDVDYYLLRMGIAVRPTNEKI